MAREAAKVGGGLARFMSLLFEFRLSFSCSSTCFLWRIINQRSANYDCSLLHFNTLAALLDVLIP